jgi:hypothetical protein
LREIDPYSSVVNEDVLHFEVGLSVSEGPEGQEIGVGDLVGWRGIKNIRVVMQGAELLCTV